MPGAGICILTFIISGSFALSMTFVFDGISEPEVGKTGRENGDGENGDGNEWR